MTDPRAGSARAARRAGPRPVRVGRALSRSLVLIVVAVTMVKAPVPAAAHQADPRLATMVEQVQPALPAGVVVESAAGIAAQLVAANTTETELEVLAPGGEPFLRISTRGVFANLESPDFYETSNPNGSSETVPARVWQSGGRDTPRFVRISAGSSWGWYDHRLHPTALQLPPGQARAAVVGAFEVPLRYGGGPVTVRGRVEFRLLLGGFQITAARPPEGVQVDVLQGRLPGLFVANPSNRPLTVLGRDQEPFLRFGEKGAEVNVSSRTHVEDRQARGIPAGPPSATPRWEVLGGSNTTGSTRDCATRGKRLRRPRCAARSRPSSTGGWCPWWSVDSARR